MTQKPNILIVEDQLGVRETLKMILKPFNAVKVAEDGKKCLEMLSAHDFDLVTLDIKLPDQSGIDLLRKIKRTNPDVEVIIITGFPEFKSTMDAVNLGASSFILKPFNHTDLLTKVNEAARKKMQLDQLKGFLDQIGDLIGFNVEIGEGIKRLRDDHSLLEKVKNLFERAEPPSKMENNLNFLEFSRTLIEAIERKDPYASGHSNRVSYYVNMIASRMGLSESEKETLQIGTYLHDIGKLGIDQTLIQKREKYTKTEMDVIRQHPDIGYNIVFPLGISPEVLSIIKHHHEFYDGTGYPHGLKEKEIPFFARIVAVADGFDAMTSNYPYEYRKGRSLEEAAEELENYSSAQFDPEVVNAFCEILRDERKALMIKSIRYSLL